MRKTFFNARWFIGIVYFLLSCSPALASLTCYEVIQGIPTPTNEDTRYTIYEVNLSVSSRAKSRISMLMLAGELSSVGLSILNKNEWKAFVLSLRGEAKTFKLRIKVINSEQVNVLIRGLENAHQDGILSYDIKFIENELEENTTPFVQIMQGYLALGKISEEAVLLISQLDMGLLDSIDIYAKSFIPRDEFNAGVSRSSFEYSIEDLISSHQIEFSDYRFQIRDDLSLPRWAIGYQSVKIRIKDVSELDFVLRAFQLGLDIKIVTADEI